MVGKELDLQNGEISLLPVDDQPNVYEIKSSVDEI
jgi:hypothetical protein